jgi:GDSL-like Lipase/Acylhydrolase
MGPLARNVAMFALAAVVGGGLAEGTYRGQVFLKDERIYWRAPRVEQLLPISAISRSLWTYNPDEGFRYTDRTNIFGTTIQDGKIVSCGTIDPINKDGSPGLTEGDYDSAAVKIAIFGDSYTVTVDDKNKSWPNRLQELLQSKLGTSVHVLNLARDGTGIAQAFDVAAASVDRYRPDLMIFAFNSSQVGAQRVWRMEKVIDGEPRILTSLINTLNTDIKNHAVTFDTFLIQPKMDAAWCAKFKDGGELDEVGKEVVSKYLRFRPARYPLWTLRRSFLWHKIVHGDGFYEGASTAKAPGNFSAETIAEDAKLKADIARLKLAHVPIVLVHLPIAPEVKAGKEFQIEASAQIAAAISAMTGKPVHGLLDYLPPMAAPDEMSISSTNAHPSKFGIEMYAAAVTALLTKEGYLRIEPH